MNKELVKQLRGRIKVDNAFIWEQIRRPSGGHNEIIDASLESLVEVVVQECMEQVWYTKEDYINENISEVIKERMKQHFGVK